MDKKKQLPLPGRLLERIKQAEIVLNAEGRKEEMGKEMESSPIPIRKSNGSGTFLLHSESASTINSQPGIPTLPFLKETCRYLLDFLIETEVVDKSKTIAQRTYIDMITATMLLHSNFILDIVISEALALEIPICSKEAYNEELDIEYIFFQEEVLNLTVERECSVSAGKWALEVVAEEVTREYTYAVKLDDLVQEAIVEEIELNEDMMEEIYEGIITAMIEGDDWLELLAEDEYSHSMMEDRFNSLPISLVHKLIKSEPEKHLLRLAEKLYTDLLYEYVSGHWLQRLVTTELISVSLEDAELFFIEKPSPDSPRGKKAPRFRTSYYE